MAVPFSQLVATTFDDVVLERNKTADQWSDSSFLKYLEKVGGLKRMPGGATLQATLDYQANSAVDFLATDTTVTGTTKTSVITAASYSYIPVVAPVNWSFFDEAVNSDRNQKVDLITSIVDNCINSHDQAFEAAMFAVTGGTDGFNTLVDLFTEDGLGTVGTIVAGTETWWKNQFLDWDIHTGATLIADYTTLWNRCAKGSSGLTPNLIVANATMHGAFEACLVSNQRYMDVETGIAGFKALKFKTADYIFSMAPTVLQDSAWMFNTQNTKLYVVKSAWRSRRQPVDHINAAMSNMKVFSVAQLATSNRSRGGVLFT
jgi:hypothetical protein